MEPMTNIALRAARKAGELIVRASDDLERVQVRAKNANDFVSEVDLAAVNNSTLVNIASNGVYLDSGNATVRNTIP